MLKDNNKIVSKNKKLSEVIQSKTDSSVGSVISDNSPDEKFAIDRVNNSTPSSSLDGIDRVNNSTQKEDKLFVSGVTRAKYMVVIAEALTAVKEVELVDPTGSYYKDTVPDVARRQWAAERSMELFGDRVTKVEQTVKTDLNDNDRKLLERLTAVGTGVQN